MTTEEVLREMRLYAEDDHYGPDVGGWLIAIEAAMREPVALIVKNQAGQIRLATTDGDAFDLFDNLGTKLYALPPDAAGELLRITEQLEASRAENSRLRRRRNEIDDEAEEYAEQVERLQRKLMLVTNFPSHPGGHPDDQSGDAMVPEDWRHGWICAVAAIQEAVAEKEDK